MNAKNNSGRAYPQTKQTEANTKLFFALEGTLENKITAINNKLTTKCDMRGQVLMLTEETKKQKLNPSAMSLSTLQDDKAINKSTDTAIPPIT